jgi:hypothetical protein
MIAEFDLGFKVTPAIIAEVEISSSLVIDSDGFVSFHNMIDDQSHMKHFR